MANTVSETTIEKLRDIFAHFGLSKQILSDKGTQFVSLEFSEFMKRNGIKHIRVAPYHPRLNGQAERFVQIFKQFFKAEGGGSIKQKLAQFLFSYRNTPNSTTGQTPAELMFKRRLRTRLDLLRPDLDSKTSNKQADQKFKHDQHSKEREFLIGEPVLVQNFRGEPKWLKATITERTGPVSYKTLVGEEIWKRHADQIHKRPHDEFQNAPIHLDNSSIGQGCATPSSPTHAPVIETNTEHTQPQPVTEPAVETTQNATPAEISPANDTVASPTASASEPQPRYPTRERKPPVRLGFDE